MRWFVPLLIALASMSCAPRQDCSAYGMSFVAYLMCRIAQGVETGQEVTQEDVVQDLTTRAERGDAQAQYLLGKYFEPTDPNESWRWNCMAAMQQYRIAQSRLGWMHRWGIEPVSKDLVRAYMWYVLAASDGDTRLVELRDDFAKDLTPGQTAAGVERAAEWRPDTCTTPAKSRGSGKLNQRTREGIRPWGILS